VCLYIPRCFPGIGAFYRDFRQMSDEEVQCLLTAFAAATHAPDERTRGSDVLLDTASPANLRSSIHLAEGGADHVHNSDRAGRRIATR
jgi:hypothetical protein